ncbi:MAG TPA: hypothetical protein VJ723_06260 [Candidatus Angelobacter sp.]|nr:hypothetical protein [Candidatus Angelobacter sp.]
MASTVWTVWIYRRRCTPRENAYALVGSLRFPLPRSLDVWGNWVGVVGREKPHGLRDLVGCTEPAERDAVWKSSSNVCCPLSLMLTCH